MLYASWVTTMGLLRCDGQRSINSRRNVNMTRLNGLGAGDRRIICIQRSRGLCRVHAYIHTFEESKEWTALSYDNLTISYLLYFPLVYQTAARRGRRPRSVFLTGVLAPYLLECAAVVPLPHSWHLTCGYTRAPTIHGQISTKYLHIQIYSSQPDHQSGLNGHMRKTCIVGE